MIRRNASATFHGIEESWIEDAHDFGREPVRIWANDCIPSDWADLYAPAQLAGDVTGGKKFPTLTFKNKLFALIPTQDDGTPFETPPPFSSASGIDKWVGENYVANYFSVRARLPVDFPNSASPLLCWKKAWLPKVISDRIPNKDGWAMISDLDGANIWSEIFREIGFVARELDNPKFRLFIV